jgi:SPP1 family phage portal protein
MPGSDEQIKRMLDITSRRDAIAFGMWQRYMLEPASSFWNIDPREADGVPILARPSVTPGAINQRLHVPYDREIVSNKVAYFASNIQLVFGETLPEGVEEFYEEWKETQGGQSQIMALAKYTVDQGTSFAHCWVVPDTGDFRTRAMRADSGFVEYDPVTGDPVYGYRYFIGSEDTTFCEVYDGVDVTLFRIMSGIWVPENTRPHGLGTVGNPAIPIIEFPNNPERIGNPEMVISLCDAYDTSMSDLSSEIAQLRLSYLLIHGAGSDVTLIKEQLQQAGIIVIDEANGDARFVDRNMNVEAVRQLQDELRKLIFEGAASYNPSVLSEGQPPTAFEVNMRFEALEQDTQITVAEWQKAFRHYDAVVMNFLMTYEGMSEYDVSDIDRIFRRTAPRNILQALVEARNAGIVLSNQTLVELSGLPIDPILEAERIKNEPADSQSDVQIQEIPQGVEVSADAGVVDTGTNVVTLNGAQVSSATEIVKAVGSGEIAMDAASNMLQILFNLTTDQAEKMLQGMDEIERALPVTDNTMDRTSPVMEGSDSEGSENGSADTEPGAGSQ